MAYLQLLDGRKLYYEDEGTGQPVVFIHGWKASSDVYVEPSRLLTAQGNYRCIRYDHCGHKRSGSPTFTATLQTLAEDLRSLITALQLEKPILVGWSMGGMTVLEYIRLYGCKDLERIVLVDIGLKAINDETWHLGRDNYTLADAKKDYDQMQADFKAFLHGYYLRGQRGYAQRTVEEQRQIVEQRVLGFDSRVMAELWYSFQQRDHRPVLACISCPVAVFHAEIMPSCSPEAAKYYDEHIPTPHRVVLFDGCSHSLIVEDPKRFVDELKSFFDTVK